jgi:hypothetical protein
VRNRKKGNCPVGRIQKKSRSQALMGTEILQKGQIKKHLSRKVKLGNVLLAGIK